MSRRFINDASRAALEKAIADIEARSSAEVVVAVRHHSGSYLHADVILGALSAFATLAFLLFSDYSFSLLSIWLDPVGVGLLVGLFSSQLPWVRAALTPAARRRARVRQAAHATFFEKGVRMTSGRTGILIYVSLLERAVEVVIDRGCQRALPAAEWTRATAALEAALRRTMNGIELATAIAQLGDLCEPHLPRSEDDVDELANEVSAP